MDAAPITWRPLGRLLVDRGLLTDEELERALEEQELTGRRLGQILVARGFLSPPVLSQALTEQYGVDLDFEGGFGSALREEIARRQQAKRPVLRIVRRDAEPEIIEVPDLAAADEAALLREHLADAESRLAELLPRLEEQWARLAEAQARIAELKEREQRRGDEHLAEQNAELAEARALLVARDARFAALEGQLEALVAREAGAEQEPEPESSHLLFVPASSGYAIAEREGAAPELGSRLELEGWLYVVSRLARAPYPGDLRRCAYLVAEAQAAVGDGAGSFGTASSL